MGFEFYGQEEEGIDKSQSLYSAFAKMEVRHKEYDRARVIYKVSGACVDAQQPVLSLVTFDSLHWTDCLVHDRLSCTLLTATSRSNLEIARVSRLPCWASGEFSTRKSWHTNRAITTFGSITLDWKKTLTEERRLKLRSREFAKCMSVQWHKSRRAARSGIGDGTSSLGSITLCSRSSKPR